MRTRWLLILCLFSISVWAMEMADTIMLPDVEISVSRIVQSAAQRQLQVSVLDERMIEQAQVVTPKDVSNFVPNVYMPDYGSAMTSSIYIRGMGSRINEPVMGMVLDGVPLLDKNMYDQAIQDVKRIELLRGPQGSLYGRNSPAGVMEIRTIQPLDLTMYHVRGLVSYGTANTELAQASYYHPLNDKFGIGVASRYSRTDGYYINEYTWQKVDFGQQAGGRLVLDGKPSERWRVTGTLYTDWIKQGAFPYANVGTKNIAYNSEGSYERLVLLPSLRAEYVQDRYKLQLVVSYQFMRDGMHMDNDYTTADIFTLQQMQRQHNATFDALLRASKPCQYYEWTVGFSGFTKVNTMHAPVVFTREGIDELILSNANKGIQTVFPDDSICISNTTLPITSSFDLFNAGVAIYHQSHFQFGNWHINASVRIDYEYALMNYLSTADVNYRFTMLMSDYKDIHTEIKGVQSMHTVQVLPRFAISYDDKWGTVYGYAAKGYKAGGFNPQIFSTVTQNQVMTDLAADMGMHLNIADPRFSDVAITRYKPEIDWTFELGTHLMPIEGLKIDVDGFHIFCLNQQVTVFPNGKTTGRMMGNAARSRIWGAEVALNYLWKKGNWSGQVDASYGYTYARFVDFNDVIGEYSGNVIPYAPQHTMHGLVSAEYTVGRKWLQRIGLMLKVDCVGRIYWNEQNDIWQPFYGMLGAMLNIEWKYVKLQLWSKNLTDTKYDVFYFRSMGNDFLQHGKPRELGVTILLDI